MNRLAQLIKRILAFFLDFNIVLILFNILLIGTVVLFSHQYGDFMNFLHVLENKLSYFITIYTLLFLGIVIFYLMVCTYILKNTVGLWLFGFELIPQESINFINIFIKFITGMILDLVLLPLNIFRFVKGQTSISSEISGVTIRISAKNSWVRIMLGFWSLILLFGVNFIYYKFSLPFQVGKRFTNYVRLLDYAVDNKNVEMLGYFIQEYKSQTQVDLSYYECIYSLLNNAIDNKICNNAIKSLNTISDNNLKNKRESILYGLLGDFYFSKQSYKEAQKYYAYFYNRKIFNDYYWKYIDSVSKTDSTVDKKTIIAKLNKHYSDLKKIKNYLLLYRVSLVYMNLRHFPKTIELLSILKKVKPKTLDYADILWYLGEASFLNKDYKKGLENMKEASKLKPQYKTFYESYQAYYNTQVK